MTTGMIIQLCILAFFSFVFIILVLAYKRISQFIRKHKIPADCVIGEFIICIVGGIVICLASNFEYFIESQHRTHVQENRMRIMVHEIKQSNQKLYDKLETMPKKEEIIALIKEIQEKTIAFSEKYKSQTSEVLIANSD